MRSTRDQAAVVAAVAGGGLGALGTFLTWSTIDVGSTRGALSATGLDGRDGRTVLVAGLVALVAAGMVAVGKRYVVAKVALLAAGAVIAIVAVAGIVDALAKDDEVEEEFGIAADRVVAEVGVGLWVVAASGVALLAAGVMVENDVEDDVDDGGLDTPAVHERVFDHG